MSATFKILSLCGGGSRGIFIAKALAELEQATGKRVQDHFDLIVGTSTGGLIAVALAFDKRPSELLNHYRAHLPQIFPGHRGWRDHRKIRQLLSHKYSNAALKEAVRGMLPASTL